MLILGHEWLSKGKECLAGLEPLAVTRNRKKLM